MSAPLQGDEFEALLELGAVGPVKPGRFEHPSVTAATEARLLQAGSIKLEASFYVITAAGRLALNRDLIRRSHGWVVIDGGADPTGIQ